MNGSSMCVEGGLQHLSMQETSFVLGDSGAPVLETRVAEHSCVRTHAPYVRMQFTARSSGITLRQHLEECIGREPWECS